MHQSVELWDAREVSYVLWLFALINHEVLEKQHSLVELERVLRVYGQGIRQYADGGRLRKGLFDIPEEMQLRGGRLNVASSCRVRLLVLPLLSS